MGQQLQIVSDLGKAYQSGGALSFRNRIINGNFRLWQRGTAALTGGGFFADRWGIDAQGSPSFAATQQPFALGASQMPVPAKYFANINVTNPGDAASGIVILRTRIEGVDSVRGIVTASFWLSCDTAGKKVSVALVQYFGTGGSPSSSVFTTPQLLTLSQVHSLYTVQFTLPSIVGKVLGSNNDDFLEFRIVLTSGTNNSVVTGMTAQTINLNVSQVQLEPGQVATPFEDRPFGLETALCLRYYQFFSQYMVGGGGGVNGNGFFTDFSLPVAMRVSPTAVFGNISYLNGNSLAVNSANPLHFRASFTCTATQTAYAIADIALSAEL